MAVVDISLNELTGAAPHEELTMQIGTPMTVAEFGNQSFAPLMQLSTDVIGLTGIDQTADLGIPYLKKAERIGLAGIDQTVLLGDLYMPSETLPSVDPTITVVAPLGGTIGDTDPFVIDIALLPADGAITRIYITVGYKQLTTMETAYQGEGKDPLAFTPDFNGKSALTPLSSSVTRMSVKRNTGWPGAPRFFVTVMTDRGGLGVMS